MCFAEKNSKMKTNKYNSDLQNLLMTKELFVTEEETIFGKRQETRFKMWRAMQIRVKQSCIFYSIIWSFLK